MFRLRWALAFACSRPLRPAFRGILLLAFTAFGWLPAAAAPKPAEPAKPSEVPFANEKGGLRHSGAYPALELVWAPEGKLEKVQGVYPHPGVPRRAAVATSSALYITDDNGATFKPVPLASADKVGAVRHIEWGLIDPDGFWLASATKGIWASTDLGKTLVQSGTRDTGLASDSVLAVLRYEADVSGRTLLAVYGESARGMSVSHDSGKTWDTFAKNFYCRGLVFTGQGNSTVFMTGARKEEPDIYCIYHGYYAGENWVEMIRDVIPTAGAVPVLKDRNAYIATAGSGLWQVNGSTAGKVGPENIKNFASIGVTWGPNADTQVFYMYEPAKQGMVYSTDALKSTFYQNDGLYVGPFVKEGAHIRANANGTVYYAVANGTLYVGRPQATDANPVQVSDVEVNPPVFTYRPKAYESAMAEVRKKAAALSKGKSAAEAARVLMEQIDANKAVLGASKVTLTARIQGTDKVKPKVVSADLSRLGMSSRAPLFDDGQHGDGAAADGIYGAVFSIDPKGIGRHDEDWRRPAPGVMPLTVSAIGDDESLAGAVGILSVLGLPESFVFWEDGDKDDKEKVAAESVGGPVVSFDSSGPRSGRTALKLAVKKGAWSVAFGAWRNNDLFGYHALAFYVKTDKPGDGDLCVALRDNPHERQALVGVPVPVEKEKLVAGGALGKEYKRVVIPISRLMRGSADLHLDRVSFVVFSGEGKSDGAYWVDRIEFIASPDEPEGKAGN